MTFPETSLGRFVRALPKFFYRRSLKKKTHRRRERTNLPSDKTLVAYYDFRVCPLTYDFIWFLVFSEIERRRLNLKHLYIVFVRLSQVASEVESDEYNSKISGVQIGNRLKTICFSGISLIPSSSGYRLVNTIDDLEEVFTTSEYVFPTGYLPRFPEVATIKQGIQKITFKGLPFLSTPKIVKQNVDELFLKINHKTPLISITIRKSDLAPTRNSNVVAWLAACKKIVGLGFSIVLIPDTNDDDSFDCFNFEMSVVVLPKQNRDAAHRFAVYEACDLNLNINNGPSVLGWLSPTTRYLTFKMMTIGVQQTEPAAFLERGFEVGRSLPFANAFQKWVWEDDDEDVIIQEFFRMWEKIRDWKLSSDNG